MSYALVSGSLPNLWVMLSVNGEGVSPRFLGAAVCPKPNDGPAIMRCCGGIRQGLGGFAAFWLGGILDASLRAA